MKTYNVQKRVQSDNNTEIANIAKFSDLEAAKVEFEKRLELQETYAGEYLFENQPKESHIETLEIESFDDETEDFETIKEVVAYSQGMKDKNNYKGNFASWYYFIAKFDGTELVYNFYDNGKDLNLQYSNIKESELSKWFNR